MKDFAPWSVEEPQGYRGHVEVLIGNHHFQSMYPLAMKERAASRSHGVAGVFCIVGVPRSFAEPFVHDSIQRNLIGALNFTEKQHVMVLEVDEPAEATAGVRLQDLQKAFTIVHPHVLVTLPFRPEGNPPHRLCNESWSATEANCNAQFRSLEFCMDIVRTIESRRSAPFDWVVRVRPDMFFATSMGDIRSYDPSKLHVRKSAYSDVWDGFAIIPRVFADVYFSARFHAATKYCWVESRGRKILSGACEHRLTRHLTRHHVPLDPIAAGLFFSGRALRRLLQPKE